MPKEAFAQCRVSAETKAALREVAERDGLSESELLNQVLETVIRMSANRINGTPVNLARGSGDARLKIRLAPEDRLLLAQTAAARKMASATYASVLVRAHLRGLAPLPKDELAAMKRSIAELGAVGRALQQIARAADKGARISGPDRDGFAAFLKIAESLRDHTKALLKANVTSWEKGYVDARR